MQKGYPRQKRITGQDPETYRWVDRKPASARPVRREPLRDESEARRAKALREQYMLLVNRALMYLLIICVVFVSFMEIGKMTQITAQEKENAKIAALNEELDQKAQNLDSLLAQNKRDAAIEDVATKRLHMIRPKANQVAYLHSVPRYTRDAVQTAEGSMRSR